MKGYDHSLLLGKMREKKFSQEKLAKVMGVSEPTLWNKIHNKTEFTAREMDIIMKVLEIENPIPYFFSI